VAEGFRLISLVHIPLLYPTYNLATTKAGGNLALLNELIITIGTGLFSAFLRHSVLLFWRWDRGYLMDGVWTG